MVKYSIIPLIRNEENETIIEIANVQIIYVININYKKLKRQYILVYTES